MKTSLTGMKPAARGPRRLANILVVIGAVGGAALFLRRAG